MTEKKQKMAEIDVKFTLMGLLMLGEMARELGLVVKREKPMWAVFDYGAVWQAYVNALEAQRKQALSQMVKNKEIKPEEVAAYFDRYVDLHQGRTFEQRFSATVGTLCAGEWPEFKKWWNLLSRDERLKWRMRYNLGGSTKLGRINGAIQASLSA